MASTQNLPSLGMIRRDRWGLPAPSLGGWGAFKYPFFSFLFSLLLHSSLGAVPRFFEANRMGILLLPVDTEVDSIIYRLRAEDSDRDYPLLFQIKGPIGLNLIYLESHECMPSTDIYCEADVYLRQPVEANRVYIFNLTVSDQRGFETEVTARIDATNGRATPISQIFLKYSPTVAVREDMPPKTVISTMTVRKRQRSTFGEFQVLEPANKIFRMTPANLVSTDSINGTLILEKKVDFEEANLHTFKVCLLQPYTDETVDTRNIACVLVSVVVQDVQDEPPIFTRAPPVTRVPATAVQGDTVTQIEAKDGDRGIPRPLRYSILPASSLYTKYFKMNAKTGVITMNETALRLREKMVSLDPILMTVTAEEVTNSPQNYPALSSSVEIAFVVLDAEFLLPKFLHESYVSEIYEDSVPDAQVYFNSPFLVQGLKGMFATELVGDKGAFSVKPGVVTDAGEIQIRVKNSFLLDYETSQQISFKLIARQVTGRQQASSSTDITVKIIDVNDNVPQFSQQQYEVEIYENITRGTSIARVYATDEDSGEFGLVRYTNIIGNQADKLHLEPTTGVITCATDNHGFDREIAAAKDNNGQGSSANTATTKLIIRVKDINDSKPRFVDSIYKGVLAPDLQRLRDPILLRAIDNDAERPNNEVVYDIIRSSYSDFFYVDRTTGRMDMSPKYLSMSSGLKAEEKKSRVKRSLGDNDTVISLTVRASDLGTPPLSDFVDVKIFKQEYGERVIRFIYPESASYVRSHRRELEQTLNALTGGSTEIMRIQTLSTGYLTDTLDPTKSEVTALVRFDLNTVIDVENLMSRLNSSEVQQLKQEKQEKETVITSLEGDKNSYLVGVVFLCIILCIFIAIFLACFFCEGCPLYRSSKGIGDDGSEGVSYVRVEDTARYRGRDEDISFTPQWWQCLPGFMRDCLLCVGYIPPGKNSRVAWSGNERDRQRVGKITQHPEAAGLQDRGGMMHDRRRHQQNLMLEDVDAGRGLHGQMMGRQGFGQDPMNSQLPPDPRRVYVLKDTLGVPQGTDNFREGNTYLLEDIENDQRNVGYGPNDLAYQQGNLEHLRPHASPHDAAFYNEQRRVRRADLGAEGTAHLPMDAGGGQRLIQNGMQGHAFYGDENQSYNQGYNQSHYPNNESYLQKENGMGQYNQRGVGTNARNYAGDSNTQYEIETDRKDRSKNKKQGPVETHIDRSTDPLDRNTRSARSSNIPGTYGYQHTKTSILRYESNKAKIEEEREELIRQGKDPDDFCISHQGTGVIIASDSRKGSVRGKDSRSVSKMEGRRSQSQFSMPGTSRASTERRGSLPEIETNIEKEAARRIQSRRNSGGAQRPSDDSNLAHADVHRMNMNDVNYDMENEKTEEIERRFQQRRSEASEALSEELHRPSDVQYANASQLADVRNDSLPNGEGPAQAAMQGQQPITINIAQAPPNSQINTVTNQSNPLGAPGGSDATTVAAENIANAAIAQEINNANLSNVVTKETIEKAIASALVNMAISNNNSNTTTALSNNTPNNLNEPNANVPMNPGAISPQADNFAPSQTTGTSSEFTQMNQRTTTNNINMSETNKSNMDKPIMNELNINNVTNSSQMSTNADSDNQDEALKIVEGEINLGMSKSSAIFEKNLKNDSSILNIPKNKRKRNKMLEKKSVFTIAYDGMKTDQLRPESASGDP